MVRQATLQDLKQIASIHRKCFPNSFSTKLGYLEKFYSVYMNEAPELFLVGGDNNTIEGFCMGYYLEKNGFMKKFLKQNMMPLSFKMLKLLLVGDLVAWRKIKSIFKRGESFQVINEIYSDIPPTEIGDLLSICVIPEARGNGLANELMLKYLNILECKNRKVCYLTVDVENERAINFYLKHSFEPYKEIPNQCRTYARYI